MSGFTKLFPSLLDSTVWSEPLATRVVWIAILALANRDGMVAVSAHGLAKHAGVSRDECAAALECFMAPDPDSRTSEHEGRRLAKVEGGWLLLNYDKYRARASAEEKREKDAIRQQRMRDKASSGVTERDASRVVTTARESHDIGEADAEADAEAVREPAAPARLAPARGSAIDGQPLGDWLRAGVIQGYESLKKPAPKETRTITWPGWRELEAWVVEKTRLTGKLDQRETGRHLIRCFLRSPRAAKLGHPIAFLVSNANEYWRDDLPPALEAAS